MFLVYPCLEEAHCRVLLYPCCQNNRSSLVRRQPLIDYLRDNEVDEGLWHDLKMQARNQRE